MKIVQINATCEAGSTGKICAAISRLLSEKGIENYILYSSGTTTMGNSFKYADRKEIQIESLRARLTGNYGFGSNKITKRLIDRIESINPSIILIHNIHAHNANLEMLFNYIKCKKIKTYWTFHDCWGFTGYCTYFDLYDCSKWKTGCNRCPQKAQYSWLFDHSTILYKRKSELLRDIDLTIVTPSKWMANLVQESFLGSHIVKVINNGINLDVFHPYNETIRKKMNIDNKYILLGVAYGWGERKGLDVFIKLSERLDQSYRIVLVGTDVNIDRKLPSSIVSIHRTANQEELAQIYSAADLFINPTREENYPTVNMEAIACGTPVISFDTGGSTEIFDETCGYSIPKGDIDSLINKIEYCKKNKPFTVDSCLKRAFSFNENARYLEYVDMMLSDFR